MSYGIEIFDSSGNQTLGMEDFTYSKIFEVLIPAPGADTTEYLVQVPGYSDSNCIVMFTPAVYETGSQDDFIPIGSPGFVPVYRSAGGDLVSVIRRSKVINLGGENPGSFYYTNSSASFMHVYRY